MSSKTYDSGWTVHSPDKPVPRLGIGTYALAWNIGLPGYPPPNPLDHFDVLRVAKELGVEAVQYADNLPIETLPAEDLDRLEAEAQEAGITLELGLRGLDLPRIERAIALAERFGSGFVRLVAPRERWQTKLAETTLRLRSLRPALERHGVKLAIENHDDWPAQSLLRMIHILGLDHHAVCLDTANSLGCLEGTDQIFGLLGEHTINLHAKDVRVRRVPHGLGFAVEGTAAGEGQIDFRHHLAQPWFAPESITVELWPSLDPDGSPPFEGERSMLEKSIKHLRPLLSLKPLTPNDPKT